MNWEVRNPLHCTTDGCTAKAEIEALREKVAALTQERDTLNAALDAKITICGDTSLAAAQARIKELREALDRLGHHEICHESCEVCKLLTTTDDSSALNRRLQEERERCAKVLSEHPGHVPSNKWSASSALGACEQAIRSMT